MSIFSDRLKELRGAESQASFATSIALNRVQYAKYEGGQNSPSVEVLERICRVHKCSADWLLGLKDNGGVNVKAGNGAAVAIGANARASAHTAEAKTACRNCRYKKMFDAYEAAAKKART
jgi:transcriptional regulator with XRE-family HTH domain